MKLGPIQGHAAVATCWPFGSGRDRITHCSMLFDVDQMVMNAIKLFWEWTFVFPANFYYFSILSNNWLNLTSVSKNRKSCLQSSRRELRLAEENPAPFSDLQFLLSFRTTMTAKAHTPSLYKYLCKSGSCSLLLIYLFWMMQTLIFFFLQTEKKKVF